MKKLSKCCAAKVEAIHEDEGVSYWLCTACHNECGITDDYQKLNHRLVEDDIGQEEYDREFKRIHDTDTYKWTREELGVIEEINKNEVSGTR